MEKGIYQLPPCSRMELLYSNIWWSDGVDLLNNGFECAKGLEFYRNGIKCVDDIWDNVQRNFLTWEEAKYKYGLIATDEGDWKMLTDKIGSKWRNLLEDDEDATYQGEWVGFYVDGGEDPALVL